MLLHGIKQHAINYFYYLMYTCHMISAMSHDLVLLSYDSFPPKTLGCIVSLNE